MTPPPRVNIRSGLLTAGRATPTRARCSFSIRQRRRSRGSGRGQPLVQGVGEPSDDVIAECTTDAHLCSSTRPPVRRDPKTPLLERVVRVEGWTSQPEEIADVWKEPGSVGWDGKSTSCGCRRTGACAHGAELPLLGNLLSESWPNAILLVVVGRGHH
jgi:hypothetical protein